MSSVHTLKPLHFRSIWISDVHLGTKGCRADYLLDFLRSTRTENLFLVGDIFDIWAMKRGVYWPQAHNDVIRTVLEMAKSGTKVIYIPGNHDEILRDYCGAKFGNVEVHRKYIHETADGRRLLLMHGDEFDSVVTCSPVLAYTGSIAYDFLLQLNRLVNFLRKKTGRPYWSLAAFLKHKVKNAVNYISSFEEAITHYARKENVDGLVCGHIHHAEIRSYEDILYCNDGDWVESCTALVERHDGYLNILHWTEEMQLLKSESTSELKEQYAR